MTEPLATDPTEKDIQKDVPCCGKCSTDQKKPGRWLPIIAGVGSQVTMLIGVITAIVSAYFYFSTYHSETHFNFATADADLIYVKVWNTGHKPSVLTQYRLVFDKLPGKELTLSLPPEDMKGAPNVVEFGAATPLKLEQQLTDSLPPELKARQYEKADLEPLGKNLSEEPVTLFIEVQESSGAHPTLEEHFPEYRIASFIEGRFP